MSASVAVPFSPRALAIAFLSEPRWSIAAAAITPRASAQALIPANLPREICTFAINSSWH
jgi:hypothetical protein